MITARVTMEENYATLSIRYNSLEQKKTIFDKNELAITELNTTPEFIIVPDNVNKPGSGKILLEFRRNSGRDIQNYFEYIIKQCNITING